MPWTRQEAEFKKGDPNMELKARAPEPLGPGFSRALVAKADRLVILRTQAAKHVLSHTYVLMKGENEVLANVMVNY